MAPVRWLATGGGVEADLDVVGVGVVPEVGGGHGLRHLDDPRRRPVARPLHPRPHDGRSPGWGVRRFLTKKTTGGAQMKTRRNNPFPIRNILRFGFCQ